MRYSFFLLFLVTLISCKQVKTTSLTELRVDGLQESVEIVRDQWGVNHIYAKNQHDLFFAQGYSAAADRLFQFEIWRRQATGTVAEILGERELQRDIGTRLFKFRGDMKEEMNYYHEDGEEIIRAYTNGVNAYIAHILKTPENLPIEFKALGIQPQKWTPEVVISRHQGLLGNIGLELQIARAVSKLGTEKVKDLYWFHPKEPNISMDTSINTALLSEDILALYQAYRKPVTFRKEDILSPYRNSNKEEAALSLAQKNTFDDSFGIGSNNWVIRGEKMADGNSYMANDPHRTVAVPSLRYMNHLVAPGWNVIGGGEPEIPGISIGHNEYGAWGLTVFRTDGEDLYVYELNPEHPNQYKYQGAWQEMQQLSETIKVKGQKDRTVPLYYTLHGPVTKIDTVNHVAYAVRCAWLEPGGSPYLASLRMDQARSWEEFQEACNYSHIPGENMIWADKEGNIGWQAVGIAPLRRNFSGLVPVPGDGRFEWDGYLPIVKKPNAVNPSKGFLATANQNVTPADYKHWDAIGFSWSDPYRGDRVNQILESETKLTLEDMKALQTDYHSLPAEILVPFLDSLTFTDLAAKAKKRLENWNYKLEATSIPAAIYVAWENEIRRSAAQRFIPEEVQGIVTGIQMARIMDWLQKPDARFGSDPSLGRNDFLRKAFIDGVAQLEEKLGVDIEKWQYGQDQFKHSYMRHVLSGLVRDSIQAKIDLGPLPRGGNAYTPGSSGSNLRQSSGATFRMIVNTGNWDAAVGTNGPGQSGDPDSPFYDNLFEPWAKDEYFPVYYSREKIDSVSVSQTRLLPE